MNNGTDCVGVSNNTIYAVYKNSLFALIYSQSYFRCDMKEKHSESLESESGLLLHSTASQLAVSQLHITSC